VNRYDGIDICFGLEGVLWPEKNKIYAYTPMSTATFSFVHKKGNNAFAVFVHFDKEIEDSVGLRNARIARNATLACVACI